MNHTLETASILVREYARKNGFRNVYNDKLKDGSRSFKIQGASLGRIKTVKKILERLGVDVDIKQAYCYHHYSKGVNYRLHVKEKIAA